MRYHLAYNPVPPQRKIPLWIPPGTTTSFACWAETFGHEPGISFFTSYFDLAEYDPAVELRLGNLTCSMAPTVHEAQGWAMRVTSPSGRSLGHTADTGPTANLVDHFRGVGLLISEATEGTAQLPPDASRGHLTGAEAGKPCASDSGTGALMLTHMWEEDDRLQIMHAASEHFAGPIVDARPGATILP